jgi:uncharacterized membrane protein YdbT with pleckstrin-like domain
MAQQTRSPRDEVYLKSTGFEVYMMSGLVFLAGVTLAFVAGVYSNYEMLLWPGMVVSVAIAAVVHLKLTRREYHAKLREIETEEAQRQRL